MFPTYRLGLQMRFPKMYNTTDLSLEEEEKRERITEVPTLCPILDILSYGAWKSSPIYSKL